MEWVGIAFFHGVPVYGVGAITQSKKAMALAAVMMAAVALGFGSPAFSVFDLIAVFLGYFAGTIKIESLQRESSARAEVKKESVPGELDTARDSQSRGDRELLPGRPTPKLETASGASDSSGKPKRLSVAVQQKAPSLYTNLVSDSTLATVHWAKGDCPIAVLGNGEFEVKLKTHQLLKDATLAVFDPENPANYVFIRFWGGNQHVWRVSSGSYGSIGSIGSIGFGWVDGYEVEVFSDKDQFFGDATPCLRLRRCDHAYGSAEAREGSAQLAQALREWHTTAFHGACIEEHSEKEWSMGGASYFARCVDASALYKKVMTGAEIARTSGGAHPVDFMIVGRGLYEVTLNELMKVDYFTYAFFDAEFLGRHAFYRRFKSEDRRDQSGDAEHVYGFGWVDQVEAIVTCRMDFAGLPYLSWQRGNHADNALISKNDRDDADRAYYQWITSMFAYPPFEIG